MRSNLMVFAIAIAFLSAACTPEFDQREIYTGAWEIEYRYEHTLKDSMLDSSVMLFEGEVFANSSDPKYLIKIEIGEGSSEAYFLDMKGKLSLSNSDEYSSSSGSFFSEDGFFVRSYILNDNGHEKRAWNHSGKRILNSN